MLNHDKMEVGTAKITLSSAADPAMNERGKFTPGPWRVEVWDYSHETPPRKELVIQNLSHRIAVLDWDEGQGNPYTIHEQEAKANARLIKSAPNMFGMLREALIILENHYDYCAETGESPFPGVGALIYGLKEVITDVEGKE